jgi:hypothetical protein
VPTTQANSLQTLLIPTLLDDGMLVPEASSTAPRDPITARVVARRCKVWGRALKQFAVAWPHFVQLLLSSLLARMKVLSAVEDSARAAYTNSGAVALGGTLGSGPDRPAARSSIGNAADGSSMGGATAYAVRLDESAGKDTLAWLGHWSCWLLKTCRLDAATKRSLLRECTAIPCLAAQRSLTALRSSLPDARISAALGRLASLVRPFPFLGA